MSIKLPKIFLDSGDPEETRKAKGLLGHLDGQTTNPSLVAKNPEVQKIIASGKKLTEEALLSMYKDIVSEIESEIAGPISVEVNANWDSTADDLLRQAEDMFGWGKNIHMKFPTTPAGIEAAKRFTDNGGRVNMTLVFDQQQAGAVYQATRNSPAPAFISPFIGRWDDRGLNGLDLVKNILKQYREYEKIENRESHVKVLAASIRTLDHLYSCFFMNADIVTIPLKTVKEWIEDEKWVPDEKYRYEPEGLKGMIYEHVPLKKYDEYDVSRVEGSLLDEGLVKFAADWKNLIG
jgi:transaldolase